MPKTPHCCVLLQMEMRLMSERDGFDEGADQVDFHRWGPANAAHKGGKVRDARN